MRRQWFILQHRRRYSVYHNNQHDSVGGNSALLRGIARHTWKRNDPWLQLSLIDALESRLQLQRESDNRHVVNVRVRLYVPLSIC